MSYSHIVWDFNGTILDDVIVGINSQNTSLSKRNLPIIQNKEHYRNMFCYPLLNYYKNLGYDLEQNSFESLVEEWVIEYKKFSKDAKLFDGLINLLQYNMDNAIPQFIISASEEEMLKTQVKDLGIADYFEDILGLNSVCKYSKIEVAQKWYQRIKPDKAVLIGDTLHDLEVSQEIGIECILIANGHERKENLLTYNVPVYDSLIDLWRSKILYTA